MSTKHILCAAVAALLAAGCNAATPGAPSTGAKVLRVTTTTGMVADIVRNVGGDRVEVTALMGAGVDPHLYKPSAGDIERLNRADVIFYSGLELEGRMTDTFVKLSRSGKPAFAVAEDIDPKRLREPPEFHGKYDPHIWFDVTLWREAVKKVNNELAKLVPDAKDAFQKNTDACVAKLDELHACVKAQIGSIPKESRVLVTAHDAFGYFGEQYDMEVKSVQGTSTATEAGAKDVQDLARVIADRKIKAVFVESSVPKETVEAVQKAVKSRGWDVVIGGQLYSDAMGNDGTPEGTYVGMVRANVDIIVKALK